MSKINEYLERIEYLIRNGKKSMLAKGVIVDSNEFLDILQKVKMSIPDEIKEANQILALREKRLRDAEEQAEEIVNKARETAEELENHATINAEEKINIAQDEADRILEEAKNQSQRLVDNHIIVEQANREASVIKSKANNYRQDILREVGGEIDKLLEGVEEILISNVEAIKSAREKANKDFN